MTKTQTTGQRLATDLRKSRRIGPRTRDRRDGYSLKADMLQSITYAATCPGYYGQERTDLYRSAWGACMSYDKHVEGYRIDGVLRLRITSMTPWEFAGFLGEMVDAGVTNVGAGEQYFQQMRKVA